MKTPVALLDQLSFSASASNSKLLKALDGGEARFADERLTFLDGYLSQGHGETAQGYLGFSLRYRVKKAGAAGAVVARHPRKHPALPHQSFRPRCRCLGLLGEHKHGVEVLLHSDTAALTQL